MKMELRVNPTSITTNEDGSMTVEGYVNRTEQQSNMLGRGQKFKEIIKRGAWQGAIDSAKEIHFLAEHDGKKILASTRNGSLQLREDENGLYMSATISPTSWGKDYYQLIKDGILNNMSFGFRAIKDAWRNMGDYFERTVTQLELFEVSVVRDPAYSSSSISARGIDLVEDVEIPDEIRQETTTIDINFEIRSEADIEAIAKKLFEMLQANIKTAEGHQEEEVVNGFVASTDKQKLDGIASATPPTEETPSEENPAEEVIKEEKVEEIVDEVVEEVINEVVEEVIEPSGLDKLKDFIKQHKQEAN